MSTPPLETPHDLSPGSPALESPAEMTAEFQPAPFRLDFAGVSDIGRMRKDNQDSGYAGPWVLAVCDGVGGAVRGDLASATAIDELRLLDTRPRGDTTIEVRSALQRAHERITQLIDIEPALNGTSTTVVVALFDGEQLTFGHVGDSRAYLLRGGRIRQLTRDHTFVQSLIDEGRLTEEGARSHPNRNLILKALDGVHDADPDLFGLDLAIGDRVLICSDGASGVLDDAQLTTLLGTGNPEQAAQALIEASLSEGSSDNITCVVADVVSADMTISHGAVVIGAAAENPQEPGQLRSAAQWVAAQRGSGPRHPSTSRASSATPATETDMVPPTPLPDPEAARYAPRPPRRFGVLRRLLVTTVVLGMVWIAGAAAWSWSQQQYYVGVADGYVTIFRGVDADLPVVSLSHAFETTDVAVDRLADFDAQQVRGGIAAADLEDARRTVDDLAAQQDPATSPGTTTDTTDPASEPSPSSSPSASSSP